MLNQTYILGRTSNTTQLTNFIREVFPKLIGIEFELMQSQGSGGGQGKPLRRVSEQYSIPSVPNIIQGHVQSIIYIRPLSVIQLVRTCLLMLC